MKTKTGAQSIKNNVYYYSVNLLPQTVEETILNWPLYSLHHFIPTTRTPPAGVKTSFEEAASKQATS